MNKAPSKAYYPYQSPIDAYGNGGFRFAEMSHRGALLFLPSGIYGWNPGNVNELTPEDFSLPLKENDTIQFLLLGTGVKQIFPSPEVRQAFEKSGMGLDSMDTGAACRTYNVLLAEKRAVAAALFPVD